MDRMYSPDGKPRNQPVVYCKQITLQYITLLASLLQVKFKSIMYLGDMSITTKQTHIWY